MITDIQLETTALLTVKNVADIIGMSTDIVYDAIHNGHLHAHRIGERKWKIAKTDVEDWLKRGAPTRPQEVSDGNSGSL